MKFGGEKNGLLYPVRIKQKGNKNYEYKLLKNKNNVKPINQIKKLCQRKS